MNPATATAAILGASAIVTALIFTNPSNAGPLNPPTGPVAETSPSLGELSDQISAISAIGASCCDEPLGEWHSLRFARVDGATVDETEVAGPGVIRRIITPDYAEIPGFRIELVIVDAGFTHTIDVTSFPRSGSDIRVNIPFTAVAAVRYVSRSTGTPGTLFAYPVTIYVER